MSLAEFEKEAEEAKTQDDLRAILRRQARQLDKLKTDRSEYAAVVYQAAHDGISSMSIPRVTRPKKDTRRKDPESVLVCLGDWQLGKQTPDYNSEVCAERIERLADKVEMLTEIQRKDHPVDDIVIALLGDLVEGEDIFPGQQHRIDASLYRQIFDGAQILAGFVRRMASIFPNVRVVGVIGNHGRIGRKGVMHPESNADAMMYEVARLITEGEGVDWSETFESGERAWYAVENIRGNKFLMFHGDQIRGGFAGFPLYGLAKKVWGWQTLSQQLGLMEPFTHAIYGHWHTPNRAYLNGVTTWCNGSTESYNTYAIESLGAAGEPCQYVMFVHADGVSAEYLVRLG